MKADDTKQREGRVVFVSHSGELGGAELQLLDLAPRIPGSAVCVFENGPLIDKLTAVGMEVAVIGPPGIKLNVRRGSGIGDSIRSLPALLRLARGLLKHTGRQDLLYANSQKAWVVAAMAAAVLRRRAIWHLHDILSTEHFSSTMADVGVWLANHFACAVVANSVATANAFIDRGGKESLVQVVHNGIDPDQFKAVAPEEIAALRTAFGLDSTRPVIGMFGRVSRWKGQHVLLEALATIPDAQVVFVGGPLFGEQDYLDELKCRVRELGMTGRVKFAGFRDDVPRLMRAVDIVVHASVAAEPFGRVVVEAMFAERPVVAARGGGVDEIVIDGVTGLLVTPGEPAELANCLAGLLSSPSTARRLASTAFPDAVKRFGIDKMTIEINILVHLFMRNRAVTLPQSTGS